MKNLFIGMMFFMALMMSCGKKEAKENTRRPNILIAISDDQSWAHAGAYGAGFVQTPSFDRVATEGVLFNNAIAPSPGCAPSRGAVMLGRYPWQNERAGNHQSIWPEKYKTMPMYLEDSGYHIGYTGKGVAPFFWALGGCESNPAGEEYNELKLKPPYKHMSSNDYTANFEQFLQERSEDTPFYFWYGATEPHRWFEKGAGLKEGKNTGDAKVPGFLPDAEDVRVDLLDYANEIEWFDTHLGKMIAKLEAMGELENTIIIVTSDNGMAFPAAKANGREYGIHVPLAVRWGDKVKAGREVDDLVSFVDIMPTLFEVAGVALPDKLPVSGKSFSNILFSEASGIVDPSRKAVFSARERHSSSRYYNLSYPMRAMRTDDYLLVWNCRPERWPAGTPKQIVDGKEVDGFTDIDWTPEFNPTMHYMMQNQEEESVEMLMENAVALRPEFELFDIREDPECIKNLINEPELQQLKGQLINELMDYLKETNDPRVDPERQHEFESHRRYAGIRDFAPAEWTENMIDAELQEILAWADKDTEPVVEPVKIGEWGVMTDRWKLVKEEDSWKLYDILKDAELTNDLSARKGHTKSQLMKYWRYWRAKDKG